MTKLEVGRAPANCQIIFIDHQPQMAFGVQSDRRVLKTTPWRWRKRLGVQHPDHHHR